MAEAEHPGDRRRGVQVDALADLVAQRAGVVDQPRRAGQVLGAAGLGEPLGQPHPQVHRPAAAVGARLEAAKQHPRAQHRDGHPAQRGDEQQEAGRRPTTS